MTNSTNPNRKLWKGSYGGTSFLMLADMEYFYMHTVTYVLHPGITRIHEYYIMVTRKVVKKKG